MNQECRDIAEEQETSESSEELADDPEMAPTDVAGETDIEEDQQAAEAQSESLEEAEEIGNYIKRDINDAAEYLMETSHEFSEWLMLDIDIIEQKVLELFLSVADKTRLELEQLARPRCELSQYSTGEITGPGSLMCETCGEIIHFTTTGHIPPCPKCHKTCFRRAEI